MSETKVDTLVINELSKAQYDGITPSDTELYFINDTLDPQYTTMPTAVSKYANQITQYVGENGGTPSSATVSSDHTDWYKSLTVDKTRFENAYHPIGDVVVEFLSHNNEGVVTWTLDGAEVDIVEYGIEYDGGSAPASGVKVFVDYKASRANYINGYFYKCTAQGTDPETYAWEQIDVQSSLWKKDVGEGSIVSKPNASQGGQAIGNYSVAEGFGSDAKGNYSHAEGQLTTTNGSCAHAEGSGTTAQANCSHAEGFDTIAQNQSEHAEGQYNKSNKTSTTFGNAGNTIHSIGIGTGAGSLEDQDRRNAVEVMQNGDVYINGIGDYDGKNFSEANTLQEVIEDINAMSIIDWGE